MMVNLSRCCNYNYSRFTALLYYQLYCSLTFEYTSSSSVRGGNTTAIMLNYMTMLVLLLILNKDFYCNPCTKSAVIRRS